jgi:hypothetical protein
MIITFAQQATMITSLLELMSHRRLSEVERSPKENGNRG